MTETDRQNDPIPIAVIDLGSNSIRMAIAQVEADGHVDVLERIWRAVRLGQDTFVSGRLSGPTMSAVISILKDYRKIIETYGVETIRAVATSATREAANADPFIDRVYMAAGLDVEIIDPSEESRLIVSAVNEELEQLDQPLTGEILVGEIGGGNALLTLLEGGEIQNSGSYRLGSIRLQEVLSATEETPERAADLIRHQIAGILSGICKSLPMNRIRSFVALGGDARFAAGQIGRQIDGTSLHEMKVSALKSFVRRCQSLAPEEISRTFDLPFADAETLNPALLVLESLVEATKAKSIIVSNVSMRDGLLLDLARSVRGHEDEALSRNVLHSAAAIGEKYRYDQEHAECVADLSVKLFDELRGELGLTSRHRLLLRVGALLHEVGTFVSGRAHHKHSYYLISNAEVFGLRGEELQVVALLTRYHRRSVPRQSHVEYISIPREQRVVVSKLAALLRVADALDRGHAQQIRELRVEKTSDELILHIPGVRDLTLERRALARKVDLFEDLLGLRVRLMEAPIARQDRREQSALD